MDSCKSICPSTRAWGQQEWFHTSDLTQQGYRDCGTRAQVSLPSNRAWDNRTNASQKLARRENREQDRGIARVTTATDTTQKLIPNRTQLLENQLTIRVPTQPYENIRPPDQGRPTTLEDNHRQLSNYCPDHACTTRQCRKMAGISYTGMNTQSNIVHNVYLITDAQYNNTLANCHKKAAPQKETITPPAAIYSKTIEIDYTNKSYTNSTRVRQKFEQDTFTLPKQSPKLSFII